MNKPLSRKKSIKSSILTDYPLHLFNSNAPVSASAIHNGLECVKAKMKLSVLQDNKHTDEEKENRLKQIDIEIHQTEEIMKHDLEYRGLLMP